VVAGNCGAAVAWLGLALSCPWHVPPWPPWPRPSSRTTSEYSFASFSPSLRYSLLSYIWLGHWPHPPCGDACRADALLLRLASLCSCCCAVWLCYCAATAMHFLLKSLPVLLFLLLLLLGSQVYSIILPRLDGYV
jgi:hypothetical protein